MKLRNYALVTAGYWVFTITDGALRMLVLLHFNELGYSPVSIAFLFLAYEFMGILTNLLGGWVGRAVDSTAHSWPDWVCRSLRSWRSHSSRRRGNAGRRSRS